MVAINEGILSSEVAPFGGIKASGMGREGSRHGVQEYVQLKYVLLGALKPETTTRCVSKNRQGLFRNHLIPYVNMLYTKSPK